jgi:methyl-accepting chemotaxis protein
MNLDSAISAHVEWKAKLQSAATSQWQLDAATISKDNFCPLGQWLHGEAKHKYGRLGAYRESVAAHAAFHREAGKIATLINKKKYQAAATALEAGGPYSAASSALVAAIDELKKEAAL